MSIEGYFEAGIRNYYKCKKTAKIIKEAKLLIRQFEISEKYNEFEDIEEYKILKGKIKQIYEQVYNNK